MTFLFNLLNIGVVFSNSSDHIATVHTTILPPVQALSLQTSDTTIKEGEVIRGTLSGGVPPYSVKSVKYVDAQGNETTSTDFYTSVGQRTGELKIIPKQRPERIYNHLITKYNFLFFYRKSL